MAGRLVQFLAALAGVLCLVRAGAHAQACGGLPPAARELPRLAILPVTVRPVQRTLTPVPATDGLIHIAFAAQVTNLARKTTTVVSIVPVVPLNGFQPSGVNKVLDVDNTDITGKVRLFSPRAGGRTDVSDIPAGASGMTFFDVTYANADDVPRLLSTRITVQPPGADAPLSADSDPVPVSCEPPVILSPPLTGDRWWNGNGCCEVVGPHRGATLPVNGDIKAPEQFAIDWVQLNEKDECCTGLVTDLNSWPFFRAPILAAAAGTVVASVNNEPEQVPGPAQGITADNAPGNYIIEDIGYGRYILYAHLHTGSIPPSITVGSVLGPGQKIGELGNTGSSTAPHLHFQVMDRPSALNSIGLPFVFDRQIVEGHVAGPMGSADDAYEGGRPVRFVMDGTGWQYGKMPAERQVFSFPAN